MAGTSLIALIDKIAVALDDIALMTKIAAKKTAGVLGDDLALNAQQVSGVNADRELPVVWAVAKGSFVNKLILVPAALLISAFIPWLITPLLMIGGLYLCFEGSEKIFHSLFTSKADKEAEHQQDMEILSDPSINMLDYERDKIKGAITTDFILSAEIIVIALGTVQDQGIIAQASVVSVIAVIMTIGVYGLVAAIVKLDDLGLYLVKQSLINDPNQSLTKIKQLMGNFLLSFAPKLMKFLAIVGTAAMFLVGGGILVHGMPSLHHLLAEMQINSLDSALLTDVINWLSAPVFNALVGFLAGTIVLVLVKVVKTILKKPVKNS